MFDNDRKVTIRTWVRTQLTQQQQKSAIKNFWLKSRQQY